MTEPHQQPKKQRITETFGPCDRCLGVGWRGIYDHFSARTVGRKPCNKCQGTGQIVVTRPTEDVE